MPESSVKHSKVNVYDFFFANKTRKTYTNIIASLVLVIFLIIFALRPSLTTISENKKKIEEYKKLNALVEKKIQSGKILQEQVTKSSANSPKGLSDEIAFMNQAFFEDYRLDEIFYNLSKRAGENKIMILSMTPNYTNLNTTAQRKFDISPETPSNKYYDLNLSLEAQSIEDAEKFLASLEGNQIFPIVTRVVSYSIQKKADDTKIQLQDEKEFYSISLSMTVYLDSNRTK